MNDDEYVQRVNLIMTSRCDITGRMVNVLGKNHLQMVDSMS